MVDEFTFRTPTIKDGASVAKLIKACPPLDTNSVYCNLLQCLHFSSTSVAVEKDGRLVGFVSGYVIPNQTNTLFIWQVAVSEEARGKRLALQMIENILRREDLSGICFIETTITHDNRASWGLFEKLAEKHLAPITGNTNSNTLFEKSDHFDDEHDSEILVKIGPIDRKKF